VPMMVGMMVMLAVVVMSRAEAHDVTLVSHVEGPLYITSIIDVKQEWCPGGVLLGVRNSKNGPRIGRIRRIFADLICENPSDPPNPWSIQLATQT